MHRIWMPLYVGDFVADTMHLGPAQRGIYISLILHAWQHDAKIPRDKILLSNITGCDRRFWWRDGQPVVDQFFVIVDGVTMIQKRVATELQRSAEISNKRKLAALQKHSISSANAKQMHTQSQSQRKKEGFAIKQGEEMNGVPSEAWTLADRIALMKQREARQLEEREEHAKFMANRRSVKTDHTPS